MTVIGRCLLYLSVSGADRGYRGVGVVGGQGNGGQRRSVGLTLLTLVGHECWQRVELLLTFTTQKHVIVICRLKS